jgi:osmotically-inducible protein OsmY
MGFLGAALLLSGTAARAADEATTKQRIERRLDKAGLQEGAQIEVEVRGDAATLRGVTMTLEAKREAGKLAKKEAKSVDNLLRVFPEPRPDNEVRDDARRAVLRYSYLSVFDSINLGVSDGVVTLQGSVRQPMSHGDLEDAVARVPGVREVKNELHVQPNSIFDDKLRRQLYYAIYGDRLRQFAGNPAVAPVRIVVENGRITLTGWVNSEVDRQVFGNMARSTLAFQVNNKLKVDGEAPEEDKAAPRDVITI